MFCRNSDITLNQIVDRNLEILIKKLYKIVRMRKNKENYVAWKIQSIATIIVNLLNCYENFDQLLCSIIIIITVL